RVVDRIADRLSGDGQDLAGADLDRLPADLRAALSEVVGLAAEHDLPTDTPPLIRLARANPDAPLLRATRELAEGRLDPALAEIDQQ
ncbi:hypothetical protein, partial [Tritonibacter sp. SIMBA_163]|uniref:hypothetical protein n=1 Tax=Tritonibacter sp. SIMBA_163 TaxID=3080868 RepID=UPI00398159B7